MKSRQTPRRERDREFLSRQDRAKEKARVVQRNEMKLVLEDSAYIVPKNMIELFNGMKFSF